MAPMAGRARTAFEMQYVASLAVCPNCGRRVDPKWLKIYGDGDAWSLAGDCVCGESLGFTFLTNGDPITAKRPYGTLGVGHSEIIKPSQLADEIVRVDATVQFDPTQLGVTQWRANNDAINRVETSLVELEKFLPEGATAIPDSLLEGDGRNSERYTRAWMQDVRERYRRLTEAVIADKPRINKLAAEGEAKRPKGIDWLERESLQAHEQWVERGKKGKGRLVVVGAEHDGMKIGRGVELSGSTFYEVAFPNVYLADVKFHGAELTDARFDGGNLYGGELDGATLVGGSLVNVDLRTASLRRASIRNTSFAGALLQHSEWDGATVEHASFAGATLEDADLDNAKFRDCDFRGASLGAEDSDVPPTTHARFEQCDFRDTDWTGRDLRGAVFVGCKLSGIRGKPVHASGVVIEDADLAAAEIFKAWETR